MQFSVVIPVYNKANTIRAAVESIYAQTVQDFEIVIVDDGSNDALEDALLNLHTPKLRLIRQENGGVSAARNTGIANAQGEYVCFLDADDLWKPHHLETVQGLIEKYPQSHMFATSHELVDFDGTVEHSNETLKQMDADFETDDFLGLLNATSYEVINTNSICVKKTAFEQENIHFEPGVRIGEDTDVWYRLGLCGKVAVSQQETTVYRREYSTATKESSYVQNWIFSLREQEILSDNRISEKAKRSYIQLLDRYKMTGSRECMAAGDRKSARRMLREVREKSGKRYMLTHIFTYLPYFVCRRVLRK